MDWYWNVLFQSQEYDSFVKICSYDILSILLLIYIQICINLEFVYLDYIVL